MRTQQKEQIYIEMLFNSKISLYIEQALFPAVCIVFRVFISDHIGVQEIKDRTDGVSLGDMMTQCSHTLYTTVFFTNESQATITELIYCIFTYLLIFITNRLEITSF